MKRTVIAIGLIFILGNTDAQQLSINNLFEVADLSPQKMQSYFSKRGYVNAGQSDQNDTIINTWQQAVKLSDANDQQSVRRVSRYQYGRYSSYCLQTPSRAEYLDALNTLKSEGYYCGNADAIDSNYCFQKKYNTISTSRILEEGILYYGVTYRQEPPPTQKIQFADDLLQFKSHECLAAFFGEQNVKKDLYYFSEKEINKCSVLFPNSARQAVFIWKDEVNLMDLSHILIGGNMTTRSSLEFNQQIRENVWSLSNGVRFNMRLPELLRINGEDFTFYGRSSENFLTVERSNKGNINFSKTGIVLDCLNCNNSSILNQPTISATAASDERLSLYVGLIMLVPVTDSSPFASR